MLSILIVLHEYGHFIVARRNGVRVNEFAVGMGPKLTGWKSPRSGTLYSLRALPIGGYCAMEGEDNKTSEAEQQREFAKQRVPQTRASIFKPSRRGSGLAIVARGSGCELHARLRDSAGRRARVRSAERRISIATIVTGVEPGNPAAKARLAIRATGSSA